MIFVTVGTTKFQFNRLMEAVDRDWGEDLVVQRGKSGYRFEHADIVENYFGYEDMVKFFKKARVVVIHGGVGSYLMAKKHFRSVPIIVPRLKRFQEHVSDHQLMLARYLKKNFLALVVKEEKYLVKIIARYNLITRKIVNDKSDSVSKLINYLSNFGSIEI